MNVRPRAGDSARVRRDEPMSRHTSWHVGGPADVFFTPARRRGSGRLPAPAPAGTPIHWIGLGSNLLVRDGGLRGVVISTHGTLDALARQNATTVRAEAGVACARIARQCVKWGLGPAEFFAGIPGTLGGALAMNAGAFGGETWRHVFEVRDHRPRRPHAPARGGRVPDRLSAGGRAGARGMVHRRAAGLRAASRRARRRGALSSWRSARHRSRSASGAAARCSPIRRAITPRA